MSRRSAPRRKVIRCWKTGDYGTTLWHHELDCGHLEVRKRRAPADDIGCERCEQTAALARTVPPEHTDHDIVVDPAVVLDVEAMFVQAQLAAGLGVPLDAVRVEVSLEKIMGAVILMDPPLIAEVIQRTNR